MYLVHYIPLWCSVSLLAGAGVTYKQCKIRGPCKWIGCTPNSSETKVFCMPGRICRDYLLPRSPVCPSDYDLQTAIPCVQNGLPISKLRYFCCKKNYNYTGSQLPYLTPYDFENAKQFPNIELEDIPLPYPFKYTPPKKNAYNTTDKWPGAQAAYVLDRKLSDTDKAEVAKAIENYHVHTCFRFFPKGNGDRDWISIERDEESDTNLNCGLSERCAAIGGSQFSKFGKSCRNAEWIIHELGHSICFAHEQDRYDRDDYIYFDTNIPGCEETPKFLKSESATDLPFDFYSSQMYRGCTRGACIQRRRGSGRCGNLWNGAGRLSPEDVRKINRFYKCDCQKYNC